MGWPSRETQCVVAILHDDEGAVAGDECGCAHKGRQFRAFDVQLDETDVVQVGEGGIQRRCLHVNLSVSITHIAIIHALGPPQATGAPVIGIDESNRATDIGYCTVE